MSFITDTIRNVEQYLAQEQREKWDAEAKAFSLESPCAGCDKTPQACTCTPARHEWTAEEMAEMDRIIDEERAREWDEHLSKFCQVHDQELTDGKCAACITEAEDERRNDR